MSEQLGLLDYVEPLRLRITRADNRLRVLATSADREASIDAIVDAINALDHAGFDALRSTERGMSWPTELAGRIEWQHLLRSTGEAERAEAFVCAWWTARGGAA